MNELLADQEYYNPSLLSLFLEGFGGFYALLFGLVGIVSLGLILFVLWRGKGPTVGPVLVLLSLVPAALGLLAYYHYVFVASRNLSNLLVAPKPIEKAYGDMLCSTGMIVGCLISLLCMGVAAIGAVIRAVKSPDSDAM